MTKTVILSGYFGFKNFGDEAILSLLISKLKQLGVNINVITSDPNYTNSLHKEVFCIKTFDIKNIIYGISHSDILISGGGSLLQDVTSIKSLIYYLGIIFIALILKKKVLIFAQGIGPINSYLGRFLTKKVLKHCSYITVRDENSANTLQNYGITSDIVPDPVFSIDIGESNSSKSSIGVQLRNCKNLNENFLHSLADSINENFQSYKVKIFSFQDSIDYKICENFQKILKEINPNISCEILHNMSHLEVIKNISECEYLLAMRFHAIIVGLLSKTKTLAINYDVKIKTLSHDFNLPILELTNTDFENQIQTLKKQNLEFIQEKLSSKKFNWVKIEKFIENTSRK